MIYCYLRVSTDTQDVNTQRIGIEEFCKAREWRIDEWIMDEGVSGAKDPSKRKLGGLLKKCQSGDSLVFSEISRIGRKLVIILDVIKLCAEKGVNIYTVKDRFVLEDTIQSKVLATVMGLAAEIERDLLRQRTKEGLQRAVASGKTLGRPRGKKSGSYIIPVDRLENIENSLKMGFTTGQIAKKMKCHRQTVQRFLLFHGWRIEGNEWLNAAGERVATARQPGHAYYPRKDAPLTFAARMEPLRETIRKMLFDDGLTIREIAKRLSSDEKTVSESALSRLINTKWHMNRPGVHTYEEEMDGMGVLAVPMEGAAIPEMRAGGGDGAVDACASAPNPAVEHKESDGGDGDEA